MNGIMSFAVDVTELVGARRSVLLSDELAAVVDLVPGGILVVDANGWIVKWNERVRRLLLSQFDAIRGYEPGTGLLTLRDGEGSPVAVADIGASASPGSLAPQAFTFWAGAPAKLVRFRAAARILREPDGNIRGAILVLTLPD